MASAAAVRPILISGAGPASLLLAQSLRRSNLPFRIFERDSSLYFRGQGYRLRLSSEGLDAIEAALGPTLFAHFYDKCGKTGGPGFRQLDATKKPEPVEQPQDGESLSSRGGLTIGIARGEMRKLFYEGLEDHVQFGKHVTGYEELPGGSVRALFADGSRSEEGSLLVGGDGLKSSIAKQVSGGLIKVYDTGARGIHGQAPTTAFKALGEGVFNIADANNPKGRISVITNVRPNDMDDPSIEFGWTMVAVPGAIQAPGNNYTVVGKVAADIAKSLTKDWDATFKPLFDEMNEAEAAFWKITCSTPSGVPVWENNKLVTVIGDAAHSMTPAGGIGANTAFRDSALLGRLLVEANGQFEGVTAAYEKRMRVYASEAVGSSYSTATTMMGISIDVNTTPVLT